MNRIFLLLLKNISYGASGLFKLTNSSLMKLCIETEENICIFRPYLPTGYTNGEGGVLRKKSPINDEELAIIELLSYKQALMGLEVLYNEGKWKTRNTPGEKRLEILFNIAQMIEEYREDFVNALVYDAGKPIDSAKGELIASVDRIRKAMMDLREIRGDHIPGDWDIHTFETEGIVRREPYGVVAIITPFNYPLYDIVMKFVSAFIAGNAIIIKPSSEAPLPAILFTEVALKAGFPSKGIMLALMKGTDFSEILRDRRIGAVTFTGSTETGKKILSIGGIKSYLMELGGGDPAIVLRDANLEQAAIDIVKGIISYSGQRCDAIKLVIVEDEVYGTFKEYLLGEMKKQVVIGDPREPGVTIGPLINKESVERFEEAVRDAVEKGGRIIYGGRILGGNYVEPALIEVEKDRVHEMKAYYQEIFAPIALLVKVSDLDEAIRIANGRPYGLDAAIFSKNIDWIRKAIRLLEVGAVYVNMFPRHGIGYYPYGGRKDSGIGIEGIGYSIKYVSAYKSVIFNYKGARVWEYY